jgi:simple sugar transport system permease protein
MLLEELFNPNVFRMAITFSAPLLIAAIGELIIERSGIMNIAIEGIMIVAAAVGFLATYLTNSVVIGIIAAMLIGGLFGLILAFFSVKMKTSQIIIGLGLLVLGMGLSSLIYRLFIGVQLVAPQIKVLPNLPIPLLSQIPFIGDILFNQNILVYVGFILVPVVYFVLNKTPLGLRIRACGENPRAIDVLGINVFQIRTWSTVIGSMIIALAGFYLPMILTGTFSDGMVGGRGWLALQLVIFGRWIPGYILAGSLFFAYIEALQFRFAMTIQAVPAQFFLILPYLFAIIALVLVYRRAESPQSLMKPYDREQR